MYKKADLPNQTLSMNIDLALMLSFFYLTQIRNECMCIFYFGLNTKLWLETNSKFLTGITSYCSFT